VEFVLKESLTEGGEGDYAGSEMEIWSTMKIDE
jgi:hypothetical protein